MTSRAGREALDHFLATAAIGLALTGLGDVLPSLTARQQALPPETLGYILLSVLIAGGTALYSYLKSHQAIVATQLAQALDQVPLPTAEPSPASQDQPAATTEAQPAAAPSATSGSGPGAQA